MQDGSNSLLNTIGVFETAARLKSFKLAADELCLTPSAVSHRIKNFEQRLDILLFSRAKNAIKLTPDGERLYRAVSAPVSQIHSAICAVQSTAVKGVTVRTNITLAARWLIPRLAEFRSIHPEINLKIISFNDVHGGSYDETDITIIYERADNLITNGIQILSDFSAPVIAPHLIKKGEGLKELLQGKWPAISCTEANWEWRLWAAENDIDFETLPSRDYFSIDETAIEGAIAGLGMVMMPPFIIERELDRGDLVYIPGVKPVHIGGYWLISDQSPKKLVREVRKWLLKHETLHFPQSGKKNQFRKKKPKKRINLTKDYSPS